MYRKLNEQQAADREMADTLGQFMLELVTFAQPGARATGRDFNVVEWLDMASTAMSAKLKTQPKLEI